MRLNSIYISIFFTFLCLKLLGQELKIEDTEYLFPIKVGSTAQLSGNMGELRKKHFHSGIDIKTQGRIGLPLLSTMDGCVSRIKITQKGYGKAIYILDINGNTNVYAHLNEFSDTIAKEVLKAQYMNKSYEIDYIPKDCNALKVSKGEIIGYSGNSGGSTGPHLHFEIRDKMQCPLDPLEYNLGKIKDNRPPVLKKIAFIPLNTNSYINDNQDFTGPYAFVKSKGKNKYTLPKQIRAEGTIGIALLADDYHNGSASKLGVKEIQVFENEQLILHQIIDHFCFDDSKKIVLFYEYDYYFNSKKRFYSLYRKPGNTLEFYKTLINGGKIDVNKGENHNIKIIAKDEYGNATEANFSILAYKKNTRNKDKKQLVVTTQKKENIFIKDGHLVVESMKSDVNVRPKLYINSDSTSTFSVKYMKNKTVTYLPWNEFYKSFGDSLIINSKKIYLKKYIKLVPNSSFKHTENIKLDNNESISYTILAKKNTVDIPTFIEHKYISDVNGIQFGKESTIFFKPITILFYPTNEINKNSGVYYVYEDEYVFISKDREEKALKFRIKDGGKYVIKTDNNPPKIVPLEVSNNRLKFRIKDTDSGIKSYECTLNDKWVLLEYDYKTDILKSNSKDSHFPLGPGTIKLVVKDELEIEKVYTKEL